MISEYIDGAGVRHKVPDDLRIMECRDCGAAMVRTIQQLPRQIDCRVRILGAWIPTVKGRLTHQSPICRLCNYQLTRGHSPGRTPRRNDHE